MTTQRIQGRVFGEVADEYDRVRPGYPAQLAADVLAYAGGPALEVGAGTGKATELFAATGVEVVATEPDPAMAAVLARRTAGRPNVTVTVSAFEEYVPERAFGLLYCAQAWHWVDKEVRWQRAAAALAPGGGLALFWNVDWPADEGVTARLLAAHERFAPHIRPNTGPIGRPIGEEAGAREWAGEMGLPPEFGDLGTRLYRSGRTVSAADYVALLSTQSSYRILAEDVRENLFGTLLDTLGEQVALNVETALYLARHLP
ncbi:class I SAM-dependent methyltransferase [Nonomuraea sp. NPDC003560]|uniref:class I SAM-dependent methyltransferase n=1 Tax=Nonomuraea sp. NPDC003560 TaxID=3364341 RepID=UPI0036C813F4